MSEQPETAIESAQRILCEAADLIQESEYVPLPATINAALARILRVAVVDAGLIGPNYDAIAVAEAITGQTWPHRSRPIQEIEAEHTAKLMPEQRRAGL